MIKKRISRVFILAAVLAIGVAATSSERAAAADKDVVGSWAGLLTVNTVGGSFVGVFGALATFDRDGGMTETDNFPGIAGTPITLSDAHGTWRRGTEKNEFEFSLMKVHRGAFGDNNVERVDAKVTVSGDTLEGEFRDTGLGFVGTITATRINVTPF